jgi:hypothetical protein
MTNTYDFVSLFTKYTKLAKDYIQKVLPKNVSELKNDAGYITKDSNINGMANRAISDQNGNIIDKTYARNVDMKIALNKKADWGTSLSDYKIADAYTKSDTDAKLNLKANTVDVYNKSDIDRFIVQKADKETTLAGYNIEDAYTKSEVDTKLSKKVDFDSLQKLYVVKTEKGMAGGVATLDSSGLVPSSQLPSYVDDVVEGYYIDSKFYKDEAKATLIIGESDKIYVDMATNHSYRYAPSSMSYVRIDDAVSTAEQAMKDASGNIITDTYETKTDAQTALNKKADKATTLSGYNIDDAYTKSEIDNKMSSINSIIKPATKTSLGTIIVGDNLNVDANGKVSAQNSYVLPVATASVLGGVKQGTDITIDKDGVLSVNYTDFTENCTEENFAKLWSDT